MLAETNENGLKHKDTQTVSQQNKTSEAVQSAIVSGQQASGHICVRASCICARCRETGMLLLFNIHLQTYIVHTRSLMFAVWQYMSQNPEDIFGD